MMDTEKNDSFASSFVIQHILRELFDTSSITWNSSVFKHYRSRRDSVLRLGGAGGGKKGHALRDFMKVSCIHLLVYEYSVPLM
jgi:hypothetical protein